MANPNQDGNAGDAADALAALTARLDGLAATNERLSTELEEARTRLSRQEALLPTASRTTTALDDDVWLSPKLWGELSRPGDAASVYLLWDMCERGLRNLALPAKDLAHAKALFRTITPFLLSDNDAVREAPEVSEALLRVRTEFLVSVMIVEHPKVAVARIRAVCDASTSASVDLVRARKLLQKKHDE